MTYVYFTVRFGLPCVFSFWLLRELSSVLVARENSFTALRFEVLVEVLVSALQSNKGRSRWEAFTFYSSISFSFPPTHAFSFHVFLRAGGLEYSIPMLQPKTLFIFRGVSFCGAGYPCDFVVLFSKKFFTHYFFHRWFQKFFVKQIMDTTSSSKPKLTRVKRTAWPEEVISCPDAIDMSDDGWFISCKVCKNFVYFCFLLF